MSKIRLLTITTFLLFIQLMLGISWAKEGDLRVNLSNYFSESFYYSLEEKHSLYLHNDFVETIKNIEIINYLSERKIISIDELSRNQSAEIKFSKGTYIIRFDMINNENIKISRQFKINIFSKRTI